MYIYVHICIYMPYIYGIMQTTWQSGWSLPEVLWPFSGNFVIKRIILFSDVTSSVSAVISYVTSQHCMCIGHMTFAIKGLLMPCSRLLAFGSSIRQVCLYHQRPMSGWCLMRVGCNVSSASPGWSLLPSNVIIVLALVNSAVSPEET